MTRIYIQDRITYKATHREYTAEGFLHVPGRVAKSGTQQYLRKELGLDGNPNDLVTVYRPPEEVFSDASLKTYNCADMAVLHPKEMIDSKTFRNVTVGVVAGNGRQEGDFVVCDMIIKDHDAIKKVESGMVELSAGYTAEYFDEKGVSPDGTPYDYVQRDIRVNHVALVPSARAGKQARLYDHHQPKGNTMTTVTLDSGHKVDLQDEAVALLVTESLSRLKATADTALKEAKDAKDESDRKQAKIDAMEEEAEKKKAETSDSVIAERLKQISDVKDRAIVIDAKFTTDSLDPVVIMRTVLGNSRPTVDWKEKSDEYVRASFDMAHEQAKTPGNAHQRKKLTNDGAQGVKQVEDSSVTAYDKYVKRMTNTAEAK